MVPQEQLKSHSFAIENKEETTPSSNVTTNIIGDLFFLWIGQKKASVLQHSVKFFDIDTTLLKSTLHWHLRNIALSYCKTAQKELSISSNLLFWTVRKNKYQVMHDCAYLPCHINQYLLLKRQCDHKRGPVNQCQFWNITVKWLPTRSVNV